MRPILIALTTVLLACDVAPRGQAKQDTTTVVPTVQPGAGETAAAAAETSGVPAVPGDTARIGAADSGDVRIHPAAPRRGGVIFALARGLVTESPRCTVDGAPLPCYRTDSGVVAVVPLPADESAGPRTLVFEHPTRRVTRRIEVAEHDFGRELVFLDSAGWALVRRDADIARDARALRQALSAETPQRRWRGAWRDLAANTKSSGYGVERFYYRASDSARAVALGPSIRTRGTFGADTSRRAADDVPSWRHAGVDIPLARGTSVRPAAAGVVSKVGEYALPGRAVVIDHGQGVSTAYFHLDTTLVKEGEAVTTQSVLGRVGRSGLTTGPHLHFGVYIHGRDVDPAAWLDMPGWMR